MIKKLFLLVVFFYSFSILLICAKQSFIDDFIVKYEGRENITTVFITSKTFELVSELESGDKEITELFKTIENIKIISSVPNDSLPGVFNASVKSLDSIPSLLFVKEAAEDNDIVRFYVQKSRKVIKELLMIAKNDEYEILFSIKGDIELNKISDLVQLLDIKGLENLEILKDL